MSTISQASLARLQRYLNEYRPKLEKAIAAVDVLENPSVDEENFSQALADLHVCATVLETYSEGMVDAIEQFTEDLPD